MTLNTALRFLEPVDPEALFGAARKAIGIPDDQPTDSRPTGYENARHVGSVPGGFRAALDMTVCPDGVTRCGSDWHEEHGHWDADGEKQVDTAAKCGDTGQQFYVELRFDTTYGFRPCCACLHMELIATLAAQFPVKLTWQDEFTSRWHTEIPAACHDHGGELDWGYSR